MNEVDKEVKQLVENESQALDMTSLTVPNVSELKWPRVGVACGVAIMGSGGCSELVK